MELKEECHDVGALTSDTNYQERLMLHDGTIAVTPKNLNLYLYCSIWKNKSLKKI